jgi:DNA recombination protein RmuC
MIDGAARMTDGDFELTIFTGGVSCRTNTYYYSTYDDPAIRSVALADYDVQGTLTDGEGRTILNEDSRQKMRPDVVLHYPDRQDVVIDAKVSIKAYYDYVNEQNEQLKRQYLDRHVQSLRSHVRELVSKDYSSYVQPPRTAIDFVIMYVPNEAALQVALAREPRLWQDAFDQKVFISSTQNLFAILRMIQIAWRQHRQTENQQKIVLLASQLLSRVGLFTERISKIGRDLQQLHADYDEVQKSVTGRLSIVQKATELKNLGVKEDQKHPLPTIDEFSDNSDNSEDSDYSDYSENTKTPKI